MFWYFGLILSIGSGMVVFIKARESKLIKTNMPRIVWLFYTLMWVGIFIMRISH